MSYPSSSSPKELRRSGMTPQLASESSTMPFTSESEKILGSASHMTDQSCQKSKDVCKEGEAEGIEAKGTNEVSDDEGVDQPKPGMEFATDKDLMTYYKRYAKQQGFGVITQRTKREADGSAKYLTIGCARGGKYHPSHNNISRPRPTTKTDCKARINAHLVKGIWVVTTVEIAHNHSTVSPQKSRFFRSHKCLDEYSQRMLDLNDGAGGGDILTDYFKRMRLINDGFVSVVNVDEDLRIINVFWVDARSRAAYEYFGDVITFDTTYLTNRYGMPFAPFVGVNHHGQSILLGAGLLSNEDTATFVWLFCAWLQCMDNRAPKAIITDQDRAMKSAIALVFPDTRHRYCLWHILQKLPKKSGSHSQFNNGLKTSILSSLYDSQACVEFEEKWGQLIQKYDLGDNAWLQGLYNERSFWVPTYLKGVFWAGMSTTQRSESMNAFFDGFVHSGMTLKEFVDQFDNALRKKVEIETTADFMSCNQTIPCVSPFHIEKQFQALYTNTKYKEVQKELLGMMGCNYLFVSKEGYISTFNVLDEITIEDDHVKTVNYSVYYNEEECELKCTCALFEMRGILCRHALKVCQMKKMHVVPEKYVLDR
ncbi:protein FAR1-RELATED SEQUENCE 4-like [Juglans regia]|uniref:Protein FAR1-RELATED SEQUENCE n=1 Tax=Juglans regia TaxID=51240 RepID=A0A6P9EF71_JUGRE|nr:protein FAR1-RELATED SEQUENCE 4-like [Juglans regia]